MAKIDLRNWKQIHVVSGDLKKAKKYIASEKKKDKSRHEYIAVKFDGSLKEAYIIYSRPATPRYVKSA
jgi:hypothetical protein